MAEHELYARSDVGRDILQNSTYFSSVPKALNEYVWNSIDYCKMNKSVEVKVAKHAGKIKIRKKGTRKYNGIVVEEIRNGGGMSREDLVRFFTMHGETLARKEGRHVRGRFGTGKAAAFGIGNVLIIDTVKNGKRNVVRLGKDQLTPGLDRVPIEPLLTEAQVDLPDGTTVIIDKLIVKRVKVESVKKFLTRSLGMQLRTHDVIVEGEKLEYSQPEYDKEWSFNCPLALKEELGEVALKLRLSKRELEQEEGGVAILSSGYPMEFYDSTKMGSWSSRLFGEVDVPLLDSDDEIPTFDNTRSKLNRDNQRVTHLLRWIDEKVAEAVTDLEAEARAKITKAETQKLEVIANELADLLNDDFSDIITELESKPLIGGTGQLESGIEERKEGIITLIKDNMGETRVTLDGDGNVIVLDAPDGDGPGKKTPRVPHEPHNPHEPPEPKTPEELHRGNLSEVGDSARETDTAGEKRKHRGGFKIDYVHEGPDAFRARWVREEMTIKLNMDYPELSIFNDIEDARFKALSGELAIAEYAIAAVNLEVENGYVDVSNTASDALIEYRRIITRLGKKIAPLMQRWFNS